MQGLFQIDVQTGSVITLTDEDSDLGGIIFQPVWSPDGNAVFYTRNISETRPIVQRDLKTGVEKELYREGPAVRDLTLSPDGRQLAFSAGGALKLLPVAGGEPRVLIKGLHRRTTIAWTRDGQYLLFSKKSGPRKATELWRIAAEGGAPEKLDLSARNFDSLRVHPDGKRIAFSTVMEPKAEVWVMENFLPAEEDVEKVVRQVWAPAVDALGSVSADRRHLSYVDWETGDLALRELATGKTRRLTNKGSWSESSEFAMESAFSPDGKQIAYAWVNKDDSMKETRPTKLDYGGRSDATKAHRCRDSSYCCTHRTGNGR